MNDLTDMSERVTAAEARVEELEKALDRIELLALRLSKHRTEVRGHIVADDVLHILYEVRP